MPVQPIDRYPWRIPLVVGAKPGNKPPPNILTGETPTCWKGNDLRMRCAFLMSDAKRVITDVSNISSVTVQFTTSQTDLTVLAFKTIQAADIYQNLTQIAWDGQTQEHFIVDFTNLDTKLDLGGTASKSFWMAIAYWTTDSPARTQTVWAGEVIFFEDGTPGLEGPIVGGNYVPQGATYDGSGDYSLSGLTAGRTYQYQQGANDTSLTNGSDEVTASGLFSCYNGTVTLHGTPSVAVSCTLRAPVFPTSDEADARYLSKTEANANYRFRNGQLQFYDAASAKWRALGVHDAQPVFGDPVD